MQKFLTDLIEHTTHGKHIEFRQLRNFRDFVKMCWIGLIIISTIWKLSLLTYHLVKDYCICITGFQDNPNKLIIQSAIIKAIDFYKVDLFIVNKNLLSYIRGF